MTQTAELPTGWARCSLGDLIEVIRGVTYKKAEALSEPNSGHIAILRANNINGRLVFDDLVYVPEERVTEKQLLQFGDIVIAASSGSKSVVGKAAQFVEDWTGSFGAFCMGLRPTSEIEPKYAGYFLRSQEYRYAVSHLAAGVNINNLKRSHIEEFPLRLAPLAEQRRIVFKIEELFSDLDAGVASLERAKANLKQYRASVLKAAVECQLTEQWRKENPDVEPASELLKRILEERRQKWEEEQLAKYEAKGKKPPKK